MYHQPPAVCGQQRLATLLMGLGLAGLLLFSMSANQAQQGRYAVIQLPAIALRLSAFSPSAPATATLASSLFLPMISKTGGQAVTSLAPQPAWTADWWQWSERVNSVPIFQQGNVDCGLGQNGELWFLAGSDGNRPIVRTCKVPPNKMFLVPLQTIAWANEGAENLSVAEKRAVLDSVLSDTQPGPLNTEVCVLQSSINGEAVENVRVGSPPFLYLGDPEAVADGYWFAFHLTSGAHVVRFRGTLCEFGTDTPKNDIDVTYTLLVDSADTSPGPPWQLFVWNTDMDPAATGCSPADPGGALPCDAVGLGRNSIYAGTPPWQYSAPASGALLTVVDTADSGDVFEVFDHGVALGYTSPSLEGTYCSITEGGDPGICLEQEGMSTGKFMLGPGQHSITIKLHSGFYAGVGYFRFEALADHSNQ